MGFHDLPQLWGYLCPGFTLLLVEELSLTMARRSPSWCHPAPGCCQQWRNPCCSIVTATPPWSSWTVSSWETVRPTSFDATCTWTAPPIPPSVTAWPDLHHCLPVLWWCPESTPPRVPGQPGALFPNPLLFEDVLTSYFDSAVLMLGDHLRLL